MTVFIASTTGITLDGEGSPNNGTFNASDVVDPITGSVGIKTVRIINTSSANVATITWTPQDQTYSFANVAYSTDSAEGVGAEFNVVAGFDAYTVTIAAPGSTYVVGDAVTVLGTEVGGSTTANDLTFTVASVDTEGGITGISAVTGTPLFPQSTVGSIKILPYGEDFVQVTNTPSIGCYFTGNCADGTMVITPVTIVG